MTAKLKSYVRLLQELGKGRNSRITAICPALFQATRRSLISRLARPGLRPPHTSAATPRHYPRAGTQGSPPAENSAALLGRPEAIMMRIRGRRWRHDSSFSPSAAGRKIVPGPFSGAMRVGRHSPTVLKRTCGVTLALLTLWKT